MENDITIHGYPKSERAGASSGAANGWPDDRKEACELIEKLLAICERASEKTALGWTAPETMEHARQFLANREVTSE